MFKILSAIIATVLVYFYIHNPLLSVIGGIGAAKLLYLIIPIMCIIKRIKFSEFRNKSYIISFSLLLFYTIIRTGGDSLYTSLVAFIEVVILPTLMIGLIKAYDINLKNVLIYVGITGSLISTACVINPSLNSFVKYDLLVTQVGSYLDMNDYRGFGISDALTSTYGIVQGALLALLINESRQNKILIAFVPFFIVSIILNARTGIIVAVIGIVYTLWINKMLVSSILLFGLSLFIVSIIPSLINRFDISNDSLIFVNDFIEETTGITNSILLNNSGASSYLLSYGLILPSDIIGLLFGEGRIIMGAKGIHSDVGFFNDIFLGGIIYCYLAYRIICKLIKDAYKNYADKSLLFIVFVAIFIANIKGIVFPNSGEIRFFVLINLFLISNKVNKEISNE